MRGRRATILIDAGSYSLSESAIAGVGLRLTEIARTLSQWYTVKVLAPPCADLVDLVDAEWLSSEDEAQRAIELADVVMFFDTPDRHRIELAVSRRKRIVAECRAPIEQMSYPSVLACPDPIGEHQRFLGPYRRLLEVAHHFICRSPTERSALISTLCTIGRITPEDIAKSAVLSHLVTTVPIGFGQYAMEMTDRSSHEYMADFLWTGGIWSFFQPMMLVEAIKILRDRGVNATAAFLHAVQTQDTQHVINELERAIDRLNLNSQVHLNKNPMTQYEREQYVKAAQAYVCIARPGAENETGTRLRLRDSWLHGIPTIIDPWGISADIVINEGLGTVLRNATPDSLADALQQVQAGVINRPGRRMEHLYEKSLQPLKEWLDKSLE